MTSPNEVVPVTYQNIGQQTGFIVAGSAVKSFNIYNGDVANILLVSRDKQPSLTNSIPVQPLTNATIQGVGPWYASALSGTIAQVTVSSSAQIQASPAQIASQIALSIASGGIPLLANFQVLPANPFTAAGVFVRNLAPGASYTDFLNITDPGYQIEIFCRYSTVNGTVPFVQVEMQWFDFNNNQITGDQHWVVPVSTPAGFVLTVGRGPTEAAGLKIIFTNLDPAQNVDVLGEFLQMTQDAARHDWRGTTPNAIPTFTGIPGDPLGLVLGNVDPTIPGNGSVTYLLPLYSGQVQVNIETAAAINFDVQVALAGGFFGMTATQIYEQNFTQRATFLLNLPRMPVQLFINNQNAAAQLYFITVLPIEFAT